MDPQDSLPLSGRDTERLVLDAQRGDPMAREELARRSYPLVHRAAQSELQGRFGGLRRRLESADLAQSALHDAFQSLDRHVTQGRGSFRRWLLGILHNKLRRKVARFLALRRDARRDVALETAGARPRSSRGPLERALDHESRELLQQAVARLNERSQVVIRRRYFEAASWRDIAAGLGVSEEAAQMLCHRALLRLQADLVEIRSQR